MHADVTYIERGLASRNPRMRRVASSAMCCFVVSVSRQPKMAAERRRQQRPLCTRPAKQKSSCSIVPNILTIGNHQRNVGATGSYRFLEENGRLLGEENDLGWRDGVHR